MKKFLNYFFTTLGVIFFVLLGVFAYLFAPLISLMTADSVISSELEQQVQSTGSGDNVETTPTEKNSKLSPEQESALESVGINPANVPSSITPEMEACFITKLGTARVAEIKAGATPSASEVFTTRSCYQ